MQVVWAGPHTLASASGDAQGTLRLFDLDTGGCTTLSLAEAAAAAPASGTTGYGEGNAGCAVGSLEGGGRRATDGGRCTGRVTCVQYDRALGALAVAGEQGLVALYSRASGVEESRGGEQSQQGRDDVAGQQLWSLAACFKVRLSSRTGLDSADMEGMVVCQLGTQGMAGWGGHEVVGRTSVWVGEWLAQPPPHAP